MTKQCIHVVGAGLSGLATSLFLTRRGAKNVQLYATEGSASSFAGGQPSIATHPHLSLDWNWLSQWSLYAAMQASAEILQLARTADHLIIGKGRLSIAQSEEQAQRYRRLGAVFNKHCGRQLASEWQPAWQSEWIEAGKRFPFGALWLPGTLAVDTQCLRGLWLAEFLQRGGTLIEQRYDFSVPTNEPVVIASPQQLYEQSQQPQSISARRYVPLKEHHGRSYAIESPELTKIGRCAIRAGHYALPMNQTSDVWLHSDALDSANAIEQYAGERWGPPDRMPYIGALIDCEAIERDAENIIKSAAKSIPTMQSVYVNTAHGSRGLIGSIAGAQCVAALLVDGVNPLPSILQRATCPSRYVLRALNKQAQ